MSGAFEFAGVDSVEVDPSEDAKPVACRGCLSERPLRPLGRALGCLYDQLVGTPVSQPETLPKYLCSFCSVLLLKFGRFRDRCRSVQTTFIDLHSHGKYPITLDHIKDVVNIDSYSYLQFSVIHSISLTPDLNHTLKDNFTEADVATLSDSVNTVKVASYDHDHGNTDDSNDSVSNTLPLANLNSYINKNKTNSIKKTVTKRLRTEHKHKYETQKRNTRRIQQRALKKLEKKETEEVKAWVEDLKSQDNIKNENSNMTKTINEENTLEIVTNTSKEENDLKTCSNTKEDQNLHRYSDISTNNNTNDNSELTNTVEVNKAKTTHKSKAKIKEKINTKQPSQNKVPVRKKLTKKTPRKGEKVNLKESKSKDIHETLKAKKKDERNEIRKLQHETKCNVKIVVLSKEEQIKQIKERRNTTNYTRALHKCEFCYRGFNTEYSYKNHMTKHDLSEGDFACDVCSMRYSSKLKLKKHAQAHHVYDFICNQCGFVSKSSADAGKHYRWHKGVKYDCKICGKTFDKPNSVMGHMHLSHGGTEPCPVCGERFLGDKGLRAHMMIRHKEALGAVCGDCKVQFHSHVALSRHRDYDCRTTGTRSCAACGEGFPSEELLQQHTLDHHKKGYVCETCGALFNDDGKYQSKAIFEDHCRTHSGERPFECHICGKRFATKQACRVHIARHSAKKGVFVSHCRLCDKHFTQHSNYKRHVRVVHQNLRPFTCSVCGAAYKDKYPLQIHVNTKHLGLPWPKRARKRRTE